MVWEAMKGSRRRVAACLAVAPMVEAATASEGLVVREAAAARRAAPRATRAGRRIGHLRA